MQQASAIALNHPSALYPRNRSLLNMTKDQLRDFASTPRSGLPKKVKPAKVKGATVSIASLMKKRPGVQKPTVVGGTAA